MFESLHIKQKSLVNFKVQLATSFSNKYNIYKYKAHVTWGYLSMMTAIHLLIGIMQYYLLCRTFTNWNYELYHGVTSQLIIHQLTFIYT